MSDLSNTQFFQVEPGPQISAGDILEISCREIRHMLQVLTEREA